MRWQDHDAAHRSIFHFGCAGLRNAFIEGVAKTFAYRGLTVWQKNYKRKNDMLEEYDIDKLNPRPNPYAKEIILHGLDRTEGDDMKLLLIFFGKLKGCSTKDGVPYPEADWRTRYVGRSGLIKVYGSEHTAAGKKNVFFYPDDPDSLVQEWLGTSAGDLQVEEDVFTLTTGNSRYVFVRDDDSLPEENKSVLLLNTGPQ